MSEQPLIERYRSVRVLVWLVCAVLVLVSLPLLLAAELWYRMRYRELRWRRTPAVVVGPFNDPIPDSEVDGL